MCIKTIDKVRDLLKNNGRIVVIDGYQTIRASGLNGVRAEHLAYDTEIKYGYSNDEIVSSSFFTRRGELFYDYYRHVILNIPDPQPTMIQYAIAKLEHEGKLDAVITRMVYGLYQKAGCKNVIEMHGSIEENHCPRCGRTFGSAYVRSFRHQPLCDMCQIPLRPGFVLLGEMIDNGKVTASSNAIEQAKILLIVGASMNAAICQNLTKYYEGTRMIVINNEESDGDEKADYRLYGDIGTILQEVTSY